MNSENHGMYHTNIKLLHKEVSSSLGKSLNRIRTWAGIFARDSLQSCPNDCSPVLLAVVICLLSQMSVSLR